MALNTRTSLENRILFTLKKEKDAVSNLSKSVHDVVKAVSILSKRKGKIIITGVGKSAFIGMKMAATLTSLGHHAVFLHPVDALHGDSGAVLDGDAIIAVSFSGESGEALKIIKHIKKTFAVKVIAVTGNRKSSLSEMSDASVIIETTGEGSPKNLAPMASTTASMVVGDLLAASLVDPSKFQEAHFAKFHPSGSLGLKLKTVGEVMIKGDRVPKISKDASFKKAILEISRKKRGIVGVVDKFDRLVGVVTDGDVRRFFSIHDSSSGVAVKSVMTTDPKITAHTDSLQKALDIMEDMKITNLFVTGERKKILGVIHLHDIIEASS